MIRRPPRSTLFPYTTPSDLLPGQVDEVADRPRARGIVAHAEVKAHDTVHRWVVRNDRPRDEGRRRNEDRKSTRLNSSHGYISYAVFCLKKKTSLSSEENEIL